MRRFGSLLVALLSVAPGFAEEAAYHYDGQVRIDDEGGRLAADWRIRVHDPDERQVVFLLRGTLGEVTVDGPGVAAARVEADARFGPMQAITVDLAEGEERIVHIAYAGVLLPEPMENGINAIVPGRVELTVDSFWFPIDRRFSRELTAAFDVRLGDGWEGVSTGEVIPVGGGLRIRNDDPRLDIAFAASTSFHVTRAEGYVIYDQRENGEETERLVAAAEQCRAFLNARFGQDDPLPVSRLLITTRAQSGYARENYIAFTEIAGTDTPRLLRFVCHEFAHYWASGVKFDTVDNWINEGFAEYMGVMAVRDVLGDEVAAKMLADMRAGLEGKELPPIWRPGDTERGPDTVAYRKAPLALARLEQHVGPEAFVEFMNAYFALPAKSTPALLDTLERTAGEDARRAFEAMLAE